MSKLTITIKTDIHLKLPMLPNFIVGTSDQEANSVKEHKFDVADLDDDQLTAFGAAWTEALLEHAQKRRERPVEQSNE